MQLTSLGGTNLYAYCLNNPVMYTDPEGEFPILITIILAATTIIGAAVGGKIAYDNALSLGYNGSKLFWATTSGAVLGGGLGLAVGGSFITLGGVISGALYSLGVGSGMFLGVTATQSFAIGALAFNFTAYFIMPFFGYNMDAIEFTTNPYDPHTINPVPQISGAQRISSINLLYRF